jgi:hypothetical protein
LPVILFSPRSASLQTGAAASLAVGAVGAGTLSYQWKRNGSPLAGKTDATLTFDALTIADGGDYTVDVKNGAGTVTSAVATLTVLQPIAGLFDTGVANGAVAETGAIDSHYVLTLNAEEPGATNVYVQDDTKWPIAGGPWVPTSDLSKWVGPRVDPALGAGGDYTYTTKLDLTGFDPASVIVSGSWAADNSVELAVNGIGTGVKKSGFDVLSTFTASGVFKAGLNNLEFKVINGDTAANPTGLRVEGLKAIGAKASVSAAPTVKILLQNNSLKISWPSTATGFVLQSTATLPTGWANDPAQVTIQGAESSVTITPSGNAKYYRLRSP